MNKKRMHNIKEQLVPSPEAVQSLHETVNGQPQRHGADRAILTRALAAAACLLLVIGAIGLFTAPSPAKAIKGLPAVDFTLTEDTSGIAASRIGFYSLINFFEYQADNIMIVRVDAVQLNETEGTQQCDVTVLQKINGSDLPDSFSFTQHLLGGCVGTEVPQLLRTGGVYLLPFGKNNEGYYLMGDYDVLFEIDDQGVIASHATSPEFTAFNGQPYTTLTDAFAAITQDKAMMLSVSPLGMAMRSGFKLVEATVTSDTVDTVDQYGTPIKSNTIAIVKDYSDLGLSGSIDVTYFADDALTLQNGAGYLLLLEDYEGQYSVYSMRAAEVLADGTVRSFDVDSNAFTPYNGQSADQVRADATTLSSR